MKELSIFIDESGDFGETRDIRDYYLVTFVFHDQANDITENTIKLENSVKESGLDIELGIISIYEPSHELGCILILNGEN